MSDGCFEPLTFGELLVDQRFITLPLPGDNHGHGGLRQAHYVFIKTHSKVAEAAPGLPYAQPHGRALNESRKMPSDFPNLMPVILLE